MNYQSMARRICGAVIAMGAVMSLAACSSSGPPGYTGSVTDADAVGAWASNCGAHLSLAAGGKATVTAFPIEWSSGEGRATKFFNGTGKWWLNDPPGPGTGLALEINMIYSLDYVTTKGGLGFSFDLLSSDYGDDATCIFSRAGAPDAGNASG